MSLVVPVAAAPSAPLVRREGLLVRSPLCRLRPLRLSVSSALVPNRLALCLRRLRDLAGAPSLGGVGAVPAAVDHHPRDHGGIEVLVLAGHLLLLTGCVEFRTRLLYHLIILIEIPKQLRDILCTSL